MASVTGTHQQGTLQRHKLRWLTLALGAGVVLTAAACFRPAGSSLEATNVAMSAPTYTVIPTETPIPSETPTESLPTETPVEMAITEEATVFALIAYTNTPDPVQQAGTEVAMLQEDPLIQTATALALIAQGVDPNIQIAPTLDPFAVQSAQDPIDPLFASATAIIQQATQTAGAPLTQTAQALLGPTITPTSPVIFPTATPPIFFTPTVAPPSGSCIHVVQAGQNLFRISLQYNTTVHVLAAANGIANPALIFVGQQLVIPNCGGGGGGVVVPPTAVPPVPGPGEQLHTVQQNETLFQISLRYGRTVNAIAARNGISNINLIFINQVLVIPA
jgi:LysM repeat protein